MLRRSLTSLSRGLSTYCFTTLQDLTQKQNFVRRLLSVKEASGLTFDEIASRLGVTNIYCAQLFYNQAQLKEETAKKLRRVVPGLSDSDLEEMGRVPLRCYPAEVLQDPTIYRFYEVITHYGMSLKAVISEKFGDGIMSAIDFNIAVDAAKDENGNNRVVVTLNGKFLPHTEHKDHLGKA
ncbi:unnamed protein product [Soboliphyme baturini]|uniref:Cyanate hydratase n=1 Tax=Soboliphyme baturini TaxID=241478 RepID=A0A183IRU0_9BILA|nr:unnamed protein product [Soboliphyme baturini]